MSAEPWFADELSRDAQECGFTLRCDEDCGTRYAVNPALIAPMTAAFFLAPCRSFLVPHPHPTSARAIVRLGQPRAVPRQSIGVSANLWKQQSGGCESARQLPR